jgi:8-oxo-dGTP pyrophosphatase MutT (NUDIX family)
MGSQKIKNEKDETLKAGCLVLNNIGEVLLVSRRDENIWTFPKGHLEYGETIEEAALREVSEETGYKVKIQKRLSDLTYIKQSTGEKIRVVMFKAYLMSSGVGEENTKSRWFSVNEAKENIVQNIAFLLDEI